MKNGVRTLLLLLAFAALAPLSASAERRWCDSYCSCFTPCAATCYWGSFLSNCAYAGPCTEQCNGTAVKAPEPNLTSATLACPSLATETAPWLATPAPAKAEAERAGR